MKPSKCTNAFTMTRDGTPVKDSNGYLVPTYDNDNITPFARLWTGYSRQATRANTEANQGSSTRNLVDPLLMKYKWRDRFPKASLDSRYLGDTYYPLCSELPPRPFLAPGARFEYTGEHSLEGALFDADEYAPQSKHKFETVGNTTKLCSGKQMHGSGSRDLASCRSYCRSNDGVAIVSGVVTQKCTHLFWASAEDRKELDGRPICNLYDDAACTGSNDMQKGTRNTWMHSNIVREKCGDDGKSCTRGRFQPTEKSALYQKLCAKGKDGKCTFPIEVRLDTRLACEGKQECEADMVRVVKMVDAAASKTAYYTFIPPKCVRQQFFEGRVIKYQGNAQSQCADPDVAGIAANVCCDKDMYPLYNNGDECLFGGESMKYKTAQERCASLYKDVGGQLCTHHRIQDEFNVAQCGPNQHAWTSAPCKVQVNVHPDGTVNIYGRGKSSELNLLSGNNFQVHWEHLEASSYDYPTIGTQADKSKVEASCDGVYNANAQETRVFLMTKRTEQNDTVATAQSGASIEWDVDACTAGSHTINFEYAVTNFRDTKISVNGGQDSMVAYQPTGSFSVFKKTHDMIFELKSGKNTIKLESYGFGMPNIRALHVSSAVDNACTAKNCVAIKVAGGSCLCDVEVENKAVYTSPSKPPAREELLRTLLIGAAHPADFEGEYTKCTLPGCNARSGVTVWTKSKTASPTALDSDTIFVLINDQPWQRPGLGKSVPLLNRASTVHIGGGAKSGNGFSFRNPGNFMPNVGEMYTTRSGWTEDFRVPNAEQETEALLNHLFWHPNVAPYVAKQLIQRFTESNPSPRYVEAVSMAFINGAYGSQKFSNQYGDLKAALYATLLDREARSSVLLADPHYGKMHEPLQELLRVMRSLEYETVDDQEIPLADELEHKVGMAAFRSETVFNFYQPDFAPPGPVAKALLVAPETQIMTAPQLISMVSCMGILDLVCKSHTKYTCSNDLKHQRNTIKYAHQTCLISSHSLSNKSSHRRLVSTHCSMPG